MRRVLVTHADSLLGRRLLKGLYHDPDVALVFATGTGPTPSFLDPYRGKCAYQRLDLAKARHVMSLFRSERLGRSRVDSVIHLPFVPTLEGEHIPGKLPALVAETRRLLEACKADERIERFVLLSSGFVYKPDPGNSNMIDEDQELDLECEGDPHVRAWVDADLLCQKELNDPALRTTILRCASIVLESGRFLLSPPLESGEEPPLGYDPMLSVVSERDVARALILALHGDKAGLYNVAGNDVFPHSDLHATRERPRSLVPVPDALRDLGALVERTVALVRGRSQRMRYGMVLDTRRAQEVLGFEPQYRIEARREGSGARIDTVQCR